MAEGFSFQSTTFDAGATPDGQLQDLQRTTFTADPSGVAFTVVVPVGPSMVDETAAQARELATAYNTAYATPGVAALSTGQDMNASGQLAEVVYVTVSTPDGRAATQIIVPQSQVRSGDITQDVQDALARLQALASL